MFCGQAVVKPWSGGCPQNIWTLQYRSKMQQVIMVMPQDGGRFFRINMTPCIHHYKSNICLICRWTHVGYAEMGGVGNEEEAAARMSAALGLPSYPLPVNETLRLCTWLKSRPASSGYLGEQAKLYTLRSHVTHSHVLLFGRPKNAVFAIYPISRVFSRPNLCIFIYIYIYIYIYMCERLSLQ